MYGTPAEGESGVGIGYQILARKGLKRNVIYEAENETESDRLFDIIKDYITLNREQGATNEVVAVRDLECRRQTGNRIVTAGHSCLQHSDRCPRE